LINVPVTYFDGETATMSLHPAKLGISENSASLKTCETREIRHPSAYDICATSRGFSGGENQRRKSCLERALFFVADMKRNDNRRTYRLEN
jgi:hypothetical protein